MALNVSLWYMLRKDTAGAAHAEGPPSLTTFLAFSWAGLTSGIVLLLSSVLFFLESWLPTSPSSSSGSEVPTHPFWCLGPRR